MPHVRHAARPCSFGDLSDGQQGALLCAASLLTEMAVPVPPAGDNLPGFFPRIQRDRKNHVVLLDGARGSGKTTALITLIDACLDRFREPSVPKPSPTDFDNLLHSAPLVPVGMVDLRPLPDKTNLVIHIAAQLGRVVEHLAKQGGAHGGDTAPWHPPREGVLGSQRGWEKFLGAAALGWDGSTSDRRARIDPEAYILELKEEELHRLDIQARYADFIDALIGDFKRVDRKLSKDPFFIIPIDDADMNPRRSAELLKVVNALAHPRVAYVLTGDSNLFHASLRNTILGELRRPLSQGEHDDHVASDLRDATVLSHELYDSIVPQNHRCLIGPLATKKRVELFKQGQTDPLAKALNEWFYIDKTDDAYGRQIAEALPDQYRHLLDVIDVLRGRENAPHLMVELAHRLWRDAIERSELPRAQTERLHDVVRFDPENRHTTISGHGLEWNTEWSNVREINIPFRKELESTAVVRSGPVRFTATFHGHPLPARAVAALVLATDTASLSDGPHRRFLGQPPYASLSRGRFCSIRIVKRASGRGVELGWPLPAWTTFWDFFVFCEHWAKKVNESTGKSLDDLALDYVEILLDMAEEKTKSSKNKKRDVSTLSAATEALSAKSKANAPYRDWAFRGAPLLREEASGLSTAFRGKWMTGTAQQHKDELLQLSLLREKYTYARVWDLDVEGASTVDRAMKELKLREESATTQEKSGGIVGDPTSTTK